MDGCRPWSDLPRDIVGLIINKLRFPDINRALAVCKGWLDCKDYVVVQCSDSRPWSMSYEIVYSGSNKYTVICDLFDLYSQKVCRVSNSIEPGSMKLNKRCAFGLASRNGWILQQITDKRYNRSSFFLHNPFTSNMLLLPVFVHSDEDVHATMKADPSSLECEIFVFSVRHNNLFIKTYCLSKDNDCQAELVVNMTKHAIDHLHSVLYMKGNVYCVFANGALYSYGLKDRSWKLLTKGFSMQSHPYFLIQSSYWLLEINENIILVYKYRHFGASKFEAEIFSFDWSKMSWVETRLESRAIYISNHVAFSAPLKNRYGEELKGCMLFYKKQVFVADSTEFNYFSEATDRETQSYGWITRHGYCFIEPPYSG